MKSNTLDANHLNSIYLVHNLCIKFKKKVYPSVIFHKLHPQVPLQWIKVGWIIWCLDKRKCNSLCFQCNSNQWIDKLNASIPNNKLLILIKIKCRILFSVHLFSLHNLCLKFLIICNLSIIPNSILWNKCKINTLARVTVFKINLSMT